MRVEKHHENGHISQKPMEKHRLKRVGRNPRPVPSKSTTAASLSSMRRTKPTVLGATDWAIEDGQNVYWTHIFVLDIVTKCSKVIACFLDLYFVYLWKYVLLGTLTSGMTVRELSFHFVLYGIWREVARCLVDCFMDEYTEETRQFLILEISILPSNPKHELDGDGNPRCSAALHKLFAGPLSLWTLRWHIWKTGHVDTFLLASSPWFMITVSDLRIQKQFEITRTMDCLKYPLLFLQWEPLS